MWTRQKRRGWLGKLVVPAITMSCLAYFASHAQSGKYGLEAKGQMAADLITRQGTYERLVEERIALERRVELLHDGTLERDMIDEHARRALNMSTPDEITILR